MAHPSRKLNTFSLLEITQLNGVLDTSQYGREPHLPVSLNAERNSSHGFTEIFVLGTGCVPRLETRHSNKVWISGLGPVGFCWTPLPGQIVYRLEFRFCAALWVF